MNIYIKVQGYKTACTASSPLLLLTNVLFVEYNEVWDVTFLLARLSINVSRSSSRVAAKADRSSSFITFLTGLLSFEFVLGISAAVTISTEWSQGKHSGAWSLKRKYSFPASRALQKKNFPRDQRFKLVCYMDKLILSAMLKTDVRDGE